MWVESVMSASKLVQHTLLPSASRLASQLEHGAISFKIRAAATRSIHVAGCIQKEGPTRTPTVETPDRVFLPFAARSRIQLEDITGKTAVTSSAIRAPQVPRLVEDEAVVKTTAAPVHEVQNLLFPLTAGSRCELKHRGGLHTSVAARRAI